MAQRKPPGKSWFGAQVANKEGVHRYYYNLASNPDFKAWNGHVEEEKLNSLIGKWLSISLR